MGLEGWVPAYSGGNRRVGMTLADHLRRRHAERTCSWAVAGCENHRGTPATYRYTADSCCGCNYSQPKAFRK